MTVSWTCPEDERVVSAADEEAAIEAVRLHFEESPHEHLSIAGWVP